MILISPMFLFKNHKFFPIIYYNLIKNPYLWFYLLYFFIYFIIYIPNLKLESELYIIYLIKFIIGSIIFYYFFLIIKLRKINFMFFAHFFF